jgi:hypothetical protein
MVAGPEFRASEPVTAAALAAAALTWWQVEPDLLRREQRAMTALAPELAWVPAGPGGWAGLAPIWPFERPAPPGLMGLLAGRRLQLEVQYGHAFPVVAPKVWSIDPQPTLEQRTQHAWHVNGDGSLCLLRDAAAWTGRDPAAELVVKAAGWFIEYLLLTDGRIEEMTSAGIATDPCLDGLITEAAGTPHGAERKPSRASSARAPSPPQSGAIHPPNSASDQRDL